MTQLGDINKEERFDAKYVRELEAERDKHLSRVRAAEAEIARLREGTAGRGDQDPREKALLEREKAAEERERGAGALSLKFTVMNAAREAGITDVDAAYRLLDQDDIELAEDGEPTAASLQRALSTLLRRHPCLRGPLHPADTSNPANPAKVRHPVETDDQRRSRLYGGGGAAGFFDAMRARLHGGGVVFDPKHNPKQRPDWND